MHELQHSRILMYISLCNNRAVTNIAHLHDGPDLLTVENLSDVSFQILWVVLINLSQKHQYRDTWAAKTKLKEPYTSEASGLLTAVRHADVLYLSD